MKPQLAKKLFVLIIAVMMFSVMPALVNAQKKCPDGNCPNGQVCVNGSCIKSSGCFTCPPFSICINGHCSRVTLLLEGSPANETVLISPANSNAISFQLMQAQKLSVKIFDMTGRLVKTLADKIFEHGEHKLLCDATGVNAGIYIVQLNNGTYSETKKISIIK